MSAAGKNYRSLIDDDDECNDSSSVMRWTNIRKTMENTTTTIKVIDIRDGYMECIVFSPQELDLFMLVLCTGWSILLFILYCIICMLVITFWTIFILFNCITMCEYIFLSKTIMIINWLYMYRDYN